MDEELLQNSLSLAHQVGDRCMRDGQRIMGLTPEAMSKLSDPEQRMVFNNLDQVMQCLGTFADVIDGTLQMEITALQQQLANDFGPVTFTAADWDPGNGTITVTLAGAPAQAQWEINDGDLVIHGRGTWEQLTQAQVQAIAYAIRTNISLIRNAAPRYAVLLLSNPAPPRTDPEPA